MNEGLEDLGERASLTDRLGRGLLARDLDDLHDTLKASSAALLSDDPISSTPKFIDYVARCMDLDWRLIQAVGEGISRFRIPDDLTLRDRVHLDIAEGLLHFHRSQHHEASNCFQNAAVIATRVPDDDLISISWYYFARTAWRKAEYQAALRSAELARTHASRAGFSRRVALISILEGWLQFLIGDFASADKLVAGAENEVKESNDHVTKGDIESYKGRRARAAGALDEAVRYFEDAIRDYSMFDREYRNVARCHQSIAYVRHLQICRLRDEEADQRHVFSQSRKIHEDAVSHSLEAERIYSLHEDRTRRRRAKVLNDRALLFLDIESFSKAAELAEGAYDLARIESMSGADGPPKADWGDRVTMANSLIISCLVQLELDENEKALAFAKQANELARTTENRRVRARAAICLGRVLVKIGSPVEASRLHSQASSLLDPEKRQKSIYDQLIRDHETLLREIDGFKSDLGDPVIVMLRATEVRGIELSETLKRVETHVIRHIYEALNKNMEATASELGINHTRVRRAVGPARGKRIS